MRPDFWPTRSFWQGRRVFLTGHTGFKGAWLALWLSRLGAHVHGFALPPDSPSLFEAIEAGAFCKSTLANIGNLDLVRDAIAAAAPEIVIHMAAQAFVRRSYRDPAGTFAINVQGTLHLLESCRACPQIRAVVIVTSDKCYRHRSGARPYCESDPLGGGDPYSASKAAAELVTAAYRQSFFAPDRVAIASVRAGNAIGGGDWGEDRLVPDAMRSFHRGEILPIRNSNAVRPWQHVCAPLLGYLMLARACCERGAEFASAWNFGPNADQAHSVQFVAAALATAWGDGARFDVRPDNGPHESDTLLLDSSSSRTRLGWNPPQTLEHTVASAVEWYRSYFRNASARKLRDIMLRQIDELLQQPAVAS